MKKFMIKLMAAVLALSMLAACGGGTSQAGGENAGDEKEGYKIGVIEVQLNDESTNRAEWYRDYIGPAYNCEFMFSEACADLNSAMSFVENAADAGCDAIISYYPMPAETEQLVQLCAEYGMVYTENGGRHEANTGAYEGGYENFAGGFQANQPATGKLFYDYLAETLDTTKEHGFLICTGSAYQGNSQQTEISSNMLNAISDLMGLKFDKPIEELYQSEAPIEATNDKGVDVYCYPGAATITGWLEGLTAALQTGKYDYLLMAPNALANVGTAVSETESAMNKDITVIGFGSFGDALTAAMSSKDVFGNQTVSMSTVKFTSIVSAMGFSKVYNVLTGNRDAVLDADGNPSVLTFSMQAVTSPEQLADMSSWDKTGAWVADTAFVDSLLAEKTAGLTSDKTQAAIDALTYDVIKARLG